MQGAVGPYWLVASDESVPFVLRQLSFDDPARAVAEVGRIDSRIDRRRS